MKQREIPLSAFVLDTFFKAIFLGGLASIVFGIVRHRWLIAGCGCAAFAITHVVAYRLGVTADLWRRIRSAGR